MLQRIGNRVVIVRRIDDEPYTGAELIRMVIGLGLVFFIIGGVINALLP